MSQIYSDAAGNKYLGDCRWGNHDINYPTTDWLKSVDVRTVNTSFLSDCSSIFSSMGYSNVVTPAFYPGTANTTIFSLSPSGESASNTFTLKTDATPSFGASIGVGTAFSHIEQWTSSSLLNINFDYVLSCGTQSVAFKPINYSANLSTSGFGLDKNVQLFYYAGKLVDVNTNFNYYNSSFATQSIIITVFGSATTFALAKSHHFIVNAKKQNLTSGRAAYAISCSDGQTPGAQWATDMWVYENNATLGYPVIGRVPNMLLGIGTYTYLKPVKIQGSVFPDNGSPWYLPVGTFAGKTLLMRCYSSMT